MEYISIMYTYVFGEWLSIWYLQLRLDYQETLEDPEETNHFIHTKAFAERTSVNDEQ